LRLGWSDYAEKRGGGYKERQSVRIEFSFHFLVFCCFLI
jgi:hypothetical protein